MTSPRSFGMGILGALLMIAPGVARAASITLVQTYDFPGATGTRILGINARGDLAGVANFNDNVHPAQTAFVQFHDGRTRLFPPAGATLGFSEAASINEKQQIGGFFLYGAPQFLTGFEFQGGVFEPINEQHLGQIQPCTTTILCGTLVADLNNPGDIVGGIWEGIGTSGLFLEQPFVIIGGAASVLPIPTGFVSAEADGINNLATAIGGTATNAGDASSGFVYDLASGAFELVKYPRSSSTGVLGVNSRGWLSGWWLDVDNNEHGFARVNGTLVPYDFPGGATTELVHLNDAGVAVGSYLDKSGMPHGLEVQLNG